MFRAISTAVLGGLLFVSATPAFAASPFDGTWKANVATAKLSQKPDVFRLKDGQFECDACVPALKVPADGKSHMIPGHDYWDAMTVTVVDPMTIRMSTTKAGKTVAEATRTISADGSTMTSTSTSWNNANGVPVTNTSKMKRVAAGAPGSHAIAGSWVPINEGAQIADANLISTMKLDNDVFTLSVPTGEHYAAKLDGPQVPLEGDKANTMIAVKKVSDDTLEESDFRNGKLINVVTIKATSPTTIAMRSEDKRGGYVDEYTLEKQ